MSTTESLDVKLGVYDQAEFLVEYYEGGTIGQPQPVAELCSVTYYRNEHNLGTVPNGVAPIYEKGGFLRQAKTRYQVVCGGAITPNGLYDDPKQARFDAQQRALVNGAILLSGNQAIRHTLGNSQPFNPGIRLFTARYYGHVVFGDGSDALAVVVYFEGDRRPPVPFLTTRRQEQGVEVALPGFSKDGKTVEYLGALTDIPQGHLRTLHAVVPISTALYEIVTAERLEDTLSRYDTVRKNHPEIQKMSISQAHANYEQLVESLRRKLL